MMSGDFEKIDLTLPTSDYALVIFHGTLETYPTESDIECAYTITPALEPSNRDWVGIYKVGWRSARDYVCFDWSVIPDGYEKGQRAEVMISFKASNLPKDDGEFYQFCYVTSAGHVRGASTPFQFRRPGSNEYVEVEDEEDEDILVIKTKTAMLEDSLTKVEREKEELSKTIEYLEKEKDSMLEKLIALEKTLHQEKDAKAKILTELKDKEKTMLTEKEANNELQILHNALTEKITVLNQEKEECVKRLDQNDAYISELKDLLQSQQEQIKSLVSEKDALTGQNRALEEEKELFKNHFTSSEGQMKSYLVEIDTLRKSSRAESQTLTDLKEQVSSLTDQLLAVQLEAAGKEETTQSDRVQIAELTERLKHSEDKLEAAEHCKGLLHTEVNTLKQTFEKLSLDLEESKSETYNYKTQVTKHKDLVQTYTEKLKGLQRTVEMKEQELADCQQECLKGKQMLEEQQKGLKTEEEGSLFALKIAYNSLSDRHEKVKTARDDSKSHLDEAMNRLKQLEKEKKDLEEDCRKRLRLGQEEYEKRVVECRRLQSELKRALRTAAPHDSPMPDDEPGASAASADDLQTSAPGDELTEVVVTGETISLMEQTASELQTQLTNLGQELEKRQAKKLKYKTMLQEEKEKRAYMQQLHFAELKKKDEEIDYLKRQLQDQNDDCNQRIATFEALLEEQKAEMQVERQARGNAAAPYLAQPPPPHMPYPMPPYVAPTYVPPPAPYYPPQAPPQPVVCPPGPSFNPPLHPHPLPTNVPPVPPRTPVNQPSPAPEPTPTQAPNPNPLQVDGPAQDTNNLTPPTNSLEFLDPLVNGESEANKDAPLPTPLSPQKSITALVAEIRAINDGPSRQSSVSETHIDMPDCPPTEEEEEEDRFHDAEEGPTQEVNEPARPPPERELDSMTGLSLRTCPVCEMVFPPQTLERELYQHVESHLGQSCPMCNQLFDEGTSPQHFTEHVQSHFNDE